MKTSFAAILAAAAGVSATWGDNVTVTTEVVTAITTYCPYATTFAHAGSTYTVSSATTLTITDCPGGCTITRPVSTVTSTSCTTTATSAPVSKPPMTYSNGTATFHTTTAAPTVTGGATTSGSSPVGSSTTTGTGPVVTAGAAKTMLSGGVFAGLLGAAAFFL